MNIALQAAAEMGWQILDKTSDNLTFHAPGEGGSYGESVNLLIAPGMVTFTSQPANVHHWPEDRNEANAANFRSTVASILERQKLAEQTPYPSGREKLGALIPSRTYLITPLLIYANVIMLIAMVATGVSVISPTTQSLFEWGGNFRALTTHGEWWRLLTNIFLHSGIIHLVANVYALLYIGLYLEPLLGKLRYTVAYVLSGVCGGLVSLYFHPYSVAVGASGAIFGLYGVFVAILTTGHLERAMRNIMLRSILFFILFNLIYGIRGNVDNAAHVGGLVCGLVIGYAYYPGLRRQAGPYLQVLTSIFLALGVTLACIWVLPSLPDDMGAFRQKLSRFTELETLALEVFRMPADAPTEDILYNLRERGPYYWNENKKLVEEMQQLNLPTPLQEKEAQMLLYCNLRLKQYELMARQLEVKNTRHERDLKKLQTRIDELIKNVKETSS